MNILFYTPFNSRSRDTESLMQAFVEQGHRVSLLTQTDRGPYHEHCERLGVSVHHYNIQKRNPLIYFIRHALYLGKFSNSNKIDVLYAHLETASLPAVLIQYFINAKVFACRHVIDEAYLFNNRNFILLNKIVYRLARNIIVVSEHCKVFMISRESVKAEKIKVIRLAYNFELYPSVDPAKTLEIRKTYPCQLLLLTACRLVSPKRASHSLQLMKKLKEKGLDCKLLVLGQGPEYENLKLEVEQDGLDGHAFLLGFRSNILDYISACDMLIHPSILDSSSVIIKEAGLLEKAVIACSGIGDVDEYLTNHENAFLVSRENSVEEMSEIVANVSGNRAVLVPMGKALRNAVMDRFSIARLLPEYNHIHQSVQAAKNPLK